MNRLTKTAAALAVAALALASPAPAHAAVDGTIRGTVTGSDTAQPLSGIGVTAWASNGRVLGFDSTDASGYYEIGALPAGTYTLRYEFTGPNAVYAPEWNGGSPFQSGATPLPLAIGDSLTADAVLEPGGSIGGTVSGPDGEQGGLFARAFAWDATAEEWVEFGFSTYAGPYPNFAVGPLPGGLSYRLWFQNYYTDNAYASEFYEDATSIDDAEDIPVAVGEEVTGIAATVGYPGTIPFDRYAGTDRFVTSALIAQNFDSSSTDHVFLASGLNYPDALSAGPAAAQFDAPLLLTLPDTIPASVASQLTRIDPGTVVVVGSAATISNAVIDQIEDLLPGVEIDRVAGPDRFATSRALAEYAFGDIGAEQAWVATGLNFPDALSASAVGGARGMPVILVNGGASTVDAATAELLADLDTTGIQVAGGPTTVSAGMLDSLLALDVVQFVNRVAGADRYETSQQINQPLNAVPADRVYLAVGTGFADALSGAALAARDGAPLFIVPGNCVPADIRQQIFTMSTQEVVLLGSNASLGVPVQNLAVC